jgi:uncharacterized protein DUF6711
VNNLPLLSINNVALPTPSDYSIGVMDLSKAERNSNGLMLIERIATKRKIQVKYNYLDGPALASLLVQISPTYFDVTYLNPTTNSYTTSSFYCGDRNVGMISFVNGQPRYKDLAFDLIER